ncbi:MAG TPA: alcohol dehydrogenase catalytic domain-containing protein [Clostridiaceae bacterium]|nr:alcohol dehydrogenase catalytic domain-containing protein [Clostridiaceae bacterium]
MKALMKTDKNIHGQLCLREVPEPSLTDDHSVKIKVHSAGICGTDVKILNGEHWCNAPVILGHEFSGVVTDIGDKVINVKIGDRVVAETGKQICGNCFYCNTNKSLMCDQRLSIGYGVDGAFAEYLVMRDTIVHKIPENISLEEAALCEPTANAVHACCDRTSVKPGDFVVVIGPGPIGLLCAQVAKALGAQVIIVGIDQDTSRLELAKRIGIDGVNSQKQDLPELVKTLSEGKGCDIVIEASGAKSVVSTAMDIVRKGGTIVQVGLIDGKPEFDYSWLALREITITGSFGHNWICWERALKLMSLNRINIKDMISDQFSLADWEKAFEIASSSRGMKVLFHPGK